ncbi:MAG TPA: YncE family protein [Actinobacteria bacterium]|nr:YncE family protein [Actinomycetota bacterium]
MGRFIRTGRLILGLAVTALALGLVLAAAGCGQDTTTTKADTGKTAAEGGKGKLYVAVTGEGELEAGGGNMGMAIVDLDTREVEMLNVADAAAPHGIMFTADTSTAPNTRGRTATEQPKEVYLANAQGGVVNVVDVATGKTIESIPPPTDALNTLAPCGMQEGPDGIIWISSMLDGKVYPLDPKTNTIGEAGPGGGDITDSICGVSWSKDGKYAYLNNMTSSPGYIAKVTWPEGKLVSKIENITTANPGLSVHQDEVTPDGKYLYATGGADNTMIKIDMDTDEIVKTIDVGAETHSIVFTPDGKTAYIAVRHYPTENQSGVFVYDVETDTVTDRIAGIDAPLICGLILQQG